MQVCIKVPSTLEGLRACKILGAEHGIHALGTMVLSVEQGIAAGEEAKCLNTSPYCNPLEVHFTPAAHVNYADPVEMMPGMRMTAQIQRQFKRRGVQTKVLAARCVPRVSPLVRHEGETDAQPDYARGDGLAEVRAPRNRWLEDRRALISGVDRATLGVPMLELMASTPSSPKFAALREKAIASYDASFVADDEIPTETKFPLEEPATALKNALARPDVAEGMKNALRRFTEAENELLVLAENALRAVQQ